MHAIALLLAVNYFAFQVELFDDEYEANHPRHDDRVAFSSPTLSWESFDKNNAPEPFVIDPCFRVELLTWLHPPAPEPLSSHHPFRDLRDKSPPEQRTEKI
jgi:hypothetical protein